MSEKNPKKLKTVQTTLNFTTESYTTSISKNQTTNVQNPKLTNKIQKSILDFLPTSNIQNKRSFKEIIASSGDDTDNNNNNDSSESRDNNGESDSDSDYELNNEVVNFPPNICQKEKKLRRNKFFLQLITPKLVRCNCDKEVKLLQFSN